MRRARSLMAQNAMVLTGLFLLAQALALLAYIVMVQGPRIDDLASLAQAYTSALQSAISELEPEARTALVAKFDGSTGEALLLTHAEPVTPRGRTRPMVRLLTEVLHRRFPGQETRVTDDSETVLWVELDVPGEPTWLAMPLSRAATSLFGVSSLVILLGGGTGLAAALLVSWRVNRPLTELAAAAAAVVPGQLPASMPETGPREIVMVRRAFNRMIHTLNDYERNRAIVLAGISHDLRTPISRLWLWLELAGSRLDDTTRDRMQNNLMAMDRIIAQFMAFARDEAEEPARDQRLDRLLADLVEQQRALGRAIAYVSPHLPVQQFRATSVRRAIDNLIDNAFAHGASTVEIQVVAGVTTEIVVRDDGPGIAEGLIGSVTKPFERGDSGQAGGSGLGLAIVERVARQHGGTLTLRNRPQGGLEAQLNLPLPTIA